MSEVHLYPAQSRRILLYEFILYKTLKTGFHIQSLVLTTPFSWDLKNFILL